MPDKWPASEIELAAKVVTYLERTGWDVYQEVMCRAGLVDIVAVKQQESREIVWAIETKTSMNLKVMAQAHSRKSVADLVSIAVPFKRKRDYDVDTFANEVLVSQHMGLLVVRENRGIYSVMGDKYVHDVFEKISPVSLRPDAHWRAQLLKSLRPQHKTYAKAGGKGSHWTPFRETMELLREYVSKQKGPVKLRDALQAVKHHYASIASGVNAIANLMDRDLRWNRKVVPLVRHGSKTGMYHPPKTGREVYVVLRKA